MKRLLLSIALVFAIAILVKIYNESSPPPPPPPQNALIPN